MSSILAIGPSNYAGQATAWARTVASNLPAQAWSFSGTPLCGGDFHFEMDKLFGRVELRAPIAWGWRAGHLLDDIAHMAPGGFMSFARWDRTAHSRSDTRRPAKIGYRMALIAHDSDMHDPLTRMAHDQWSYSTVGNEKWWSSLIRRTELNRSFVIFCDWPAFHLTPNTGLDLSFSTWLPVVVDAEAWAPDAPLLRHEEPLVVHAPSQRKPPIKDAQSIDLVLRRLHDGDAIEYVAPSGLPHTQLRELVRSYNMAVDQVMFGSYGMVTVEVMAVSRVCVGCVNEAIRNRLPEPPHLLGTAPGDLYKTIASIRGRCGEPCTRVAKNRAFAEEWHDGRVSVERLAPFLGVG